MNKSNFLNIREAALINLYYLENMIQKQRKDLEQVTRENWKLQSGEKKRVSFRNLFTRKTVIQNNQVCCA
jgi:hypothetical protein